MTTVDWIIVAVVLISVLVGLLRGVTREIVSLAGWVTGLVLASAKLSALDRLLGAAFGFARAALVLGVAVLLASGTPVPKAGWWKESLLLPWLEAGVAFATPLLPESLARLRSRS